MNAQIAAVGTTPTIGELFVGALMYSTVDEVRSVLRFVDDTDLEEPASTVLAAVRGLALRDTPPAPQLVQADLKRQGRLTRSTAVWLNAATTSGAASSAATAYASAVVAEAFWRKVESFGHALTSTSIDASQSEIAVSEAEIAALVERTVHGIRGVAARLAELRGDES